MDSRFAVGSGLKDFSLDEVVVRLSLSGSFALPVELQPALAERLMGLEPMT
jgi:hypothetical protein